MRTVLLGTAVLIVAGPAAALAIPGPATTAVIANRNLPESVALARQYVDARSIPERQLCLLDLPNEETVSFQVYLDRLDGPFDTCLSDARVDARIEAVVLMRGVPLRVTVPARLDQGAQRASVAALLQSSRATLLSDGSARLIDSFSPGQAAMCGPSPCTVARWENAYRSGRFERGWNGQRSGIRQRPWLVTMLHGRSYADAARLIASATQAESSTVAKANARFLLMAGADPARGALDPGYFTVAANLESLGFGVERVDFNANRTGETLAGFVTGAARLDTTIEGNNYLPGALVDNLTSFGAVPENFRVTGEERQVSIARWVAKGVAGAHGTTDEPLNNSFPFRQFLVDWAAGWTLAEAYHRNLPFIYWRNLVLGDAMAAAWAERPSVALQEVIPGQAVAGSTFLSVVAEPQAEVTSVVLYVDGLEVERAAGGALARTCIPVPEKASVQLLAVAQTRASGSVAAAKGWTAVTVEGRPGPSDCTPPADAGVAPDGRLSDASGPPDMAGPDAGLSPDAGAVSDAGAPLDRSPIAGGEADESEGCTCVGPHENGDRAHLFGALIVLLGLQHRCPRRQRKRPC